MDRKSIVVVCAFALTLLLTAFETVAVAPQAQPRPGRVVEYGSNGPLAVGIKAWPESSQTGTEGNCPLYGKAPLDSTESSSKDGSFTLKIDPKLNTYTVTYCANGYYPRADRDLRASNPFVAPRPVRLYSQGPLDATLVRMEVVNALNNLAYLRSIDSSAFDSALKDLPRSEKVSGAIKDWSGK
ncbi:MAG: hypothetical protein QOH71_1508 [Blastocatellia bacterium]|jgi:hypothetical protein|nr:hypothetical protein [Blastocatellia bacterium]